MQTVYDAAGGYEGLLRLARRWEGPTTFSAEYGDESSVVRIHSGNGPHEEMGLRAIACFRYIYDISR